MPTNTGHVPLTAPGGIPAAWAPGWRALLETRWQARLEEITELALAYHDVTAAGREEQPRARRLLRQVVASRRALAETEEALARLSSGSYGRCEDCGRGIAAELLAVTPETRYCPRCAATAPPAALARPPR
jgi:RNA polymerase-binding transcription factor DksA